MIISTAYAQTGAPFPTPSLWDVFVAEPSFLLINFFVLMIFVLLAWFVRRRYAKFFNLQREALQHRKTTDAQALAHNQSVEQLIARQYGVINAHNQQTLARAEEALRISNETLAQIVDMNRSIAHIAERLDRVGGPAA